MFYLLVLINKHPLLTSGWLVAAFYMLLGEKRRVDFARGLAGKPGVVAVALGLIPILCYVSLLVWYVSSYNYSDCVEPNVSAVSWLFERGGMIYHGLDSAERYSLLYGPMLFVINGSFLRLLGPGIPASKFAGAAAASLSLVFMFLLARRYIGRRQAIIAVGLAALVLLSFGPCSYWARPDPIILLCVSIGVYGVARGGRATASLAAALTLGLAVNLKVTSVLYFLPVYALLFTRMGAASAFVSLLGASVAAFAPFVISPAISLGNYILWLYEASRHQVDPGLLASSAEWAAVLISPVVALYLWDPRAKASIRRNGALTASLLLSTAATVAVASKAGAGKYHIMPLIPLILYSVLHALEAGKVKSLHPCGQNGAFRKFFSFWFALLLFFVIISVFAQDRTVRYVRGGGAGRAVVEDMAGVMRRYPGRTIAMGYGGNYQSTFYRPVLVYAGNPYLVDAQAMMDMQASGILIPQKTVDAIGSGSTGIWLIPKGGRPFDMPNNYDGFPQLFSKKFRDAFLDSYEPRESTEFFDIWFYKNKP
jgi:hypothetical protein